jgi:hypothetical protein
LGEGSARRKAATYTQNNRLRVFENRVLKRIFGPKRNETIRGSRKKLHIEDLRNFYFSSNIFRMFKSIKIAWARHVARMGRN